jgi:topoisomerase-4 subunit A
MTVNEILKYNTNQTVELLKRELQIKKGELMEKILFSSLEKIFIENRIYRNIEDCESWEEVIQTIDKGLKPHKKKFYREITTDDIVRLTEIKIKRISRYDSFKADELLKDLEKDLKQTQHHLRNLVEYAISYYANLLEKYGKGRERKTEIKSFQSVTAVEVIANNQKLYVNRTDGFIGWGLKKDEYICDCSELDDIVVVRKDGKARVSRIQEKVFMGKDILYVGVWKKGDDRMIYNLIYTDAKTGKGFAKRFAMPGVTRDKEYDLTSGSPNSKIHYVSGNPNGEAEVVEVKLSQSSTARKKVFEYDFADLEIKGRGTRGNTITKYPIRKVDFLKAGASTLSKLDLWYDDASGRLNKDKRGRYVGKFDGDDQIIAFMRNGSYKITNYDLTNRYEPEKTLWVEKFHPNRVVSAIYVDGESKQHIVKRFMIETSTPDKEFNFISETIGSRLVVVTTSENPEVEIEVSKGKGKEKKTEVVSLDDLIDVKGWKAIGNRLSQDKVLNVRLTEEPEESGPEEGEEDEASETEGAKAESSQGLKKKAEPEQWLEPGEQASLFGEAPKNQAPSHHQQKSRSRPKVKAEQQSLFGEQKGESGKQKGESEKQKAESEKQKAESIKQKAESVKQKAESGRQKGEMEAETKTGEAGKAFEVGDTVEFKL